MSEKEVFPEYSGRSLAEIPGTVFSIFNIETELEKLDEEILDTSKDYENVLLILIDGFGLSQLENFSGGFFEKIIQVGELNKITSVFPSATPATLTSINTGRKPVEHGLLGWEMYYREIDSKIVTLPFRTLDGEKPHEIFEDFEPEMLFEGEPVYPELSEKGVKCFSVTSRETVDSEYTGLVKKGSEKISYLNTADMMLQIKNTLEEENGKKYIYGYTPDVDSIGHLRGPKTPDEKNQLEMISDALERNLVENIDQNKVEDTLVMITADHGQIRHGEKIDLFQWEEVTDCIKKDGNGDLITPSGNPGRSVFLHVEDGKIGQVQSFLEGKIGGKVLKTEEAVEKGYFGEEDECEKFRDRAGELVIIGDEDKIYWSEPEELEDIGVHGGLRKEEMEIPLLTAELSELVEQDN